MNLYPINMHLFVGNFTMSFRVASLALGQSYDCPSASEATLCFGYIYSSLCVFVGNLLISFRVASLALGQSYDCSVPVKQPFVLVISIVLCVFLLVIYSYHSGLLQWHLGNHMIAQYQ